MDKLFSHREQELASLSDLLGKLVIDPEVRSSQLMTAALHQLFLFKMSVSGNFRWVWIKCLAVISRSSSALSGIPENI